MKKYAITFGALILACAMGASAHAQSPVSNFDNGYLVDHPGVAHKLANNPALINNDTFLANHPGLEGFLSAHPQVARDLHNHPYKFLDDTWVRGNYGGPEGITHGEVGRFDRGYLDDHPEVAQELGRNPGLIDSPEFRQSHPGLQDYFANHPEIARELKDHPDRFIARADGYANGGPHPLASTDRYLDSHPDVAGQLERHPGLVDNPAYLANHPGLHEYLQTHPVARADWKQHPHKYIAAENNYRKKH